jgi:4-hydroxybenzoate polyprenyltransferase
MSAHPALDTSLAPIAVDLDGTLIRSDLLYESALALVKLNPLYLFLLPWWLLKGKAHLKHEIARRVSLDASSLPYRASLVEWLKVQKAAGHALWLCTASNRSMAEAVAAHLGIFDGVLSSDGQRNLSGSNKADALSAQFGEGKFDYCGDNAVDVAVWKRSHRAVVVSRSAVLAARAKSVCEITEVHPVEPRRVRTLFKALRLHQWAKNTLVFVPLAAAHKVGEPGALSSVVLAFLAFGLVASSVYLLNDMFDLQADRLHPRKRKRPFASGDLPLIVGVMLAPVLLLGAGLITLMLPWHFAAVLAGYFVLTLAYSLHFKQLLIVDAMCLAALYTVRIVAGAAAVNVPLSFWLLLFSVFLFLSLALVKRYAELDVMRRAGKMYAAGRGYHVEDLTVLQSLGTASGYLSVLVLALYINSPAVEPLYRRPQVIWFLCVLMLYWVSRVWMKAHRGDMHDDPVLFALRDRISLGIGLLTAITLFLAT